MYLTGLGNTCTCSRFELCLTGSGRNIFELCLTGSGRNRFDMFLTGS